MGIFAAIVNTVSVYFPAWCVGVIIALLLSSVTWFMGTKVYSIIYSLIAGISFIPVTVLLPYFLRNLGLEFFVYPLLSLPVILNMYSSLYESLKHSNLSRKSLLINYKMNRAKFFFVILLREALPNLHQSLRSTLSLSFAIFLALDYFLESWGGLGSLVRYHYNRALFSNTNHNTLLAAVVIITGIIGCAQVLILKLSLKPFIEFRKHY